jgi:UDP-N-acetylglucosamine 2-epimerase (non-hydrolysing)
MLKVMVVAGTRPEVIKLAPVLRVLQERRQQFQTIYCNSGQHREMARQANAVFELHPDIDLDVMTDAQSLASLTTVLSTRIAECLERIRPHVVVVQGDTATAFVAALTAFYAKIPVAHVEAGLRTHDLQAPFPEEANRQLIARVASVHFAPTESSKQNLISEGIRTDCIQVTGNTIVDALRWIVEANSSAAMSRKIEAECGGAFPDEYVLVTMHRRETIGAGHIEVARAINSILRRYPSLHVLMPVHPNPAVSGPINEMLGGHERVRLLRPVSYAAMLRLIASARLVMSDSGGVQEEAPSFGVPVVILREVTERHELVSSGFGVVAGTDQARIDIAVDQLLARPIQSKSGADVANPFGDGRAAQRIVETIANRFQAS